MKRGFKYLYIVIAVFLYYVSAVGLNWVAFKEFRSELYWSYASTYSPLFLFQTVFFPLTLILLYRPIRTYAIVLFTLMRRFEWNTLIKTIWPIAFSVIFAVTAPIIEFNKRPAIWEVSPTLSKIPDNMATYDVDDYFKNTYFDRIDDYGNTWKTDKSWPNIFFYLRAMDNLSLIHI